MTIEACQAGQGAVAVTLAWAQARVGDIETAQMLLAQCVDSSFEEELRAAVFQARELCQQCVNTHLEAKADLL